MAQTLVNSPIGYWLLEANDQFLTRVSHLRVKPLELLPSNGLLSMAQTQLEEYFSNKRQTFSVPLDRESYSSFYQSVWKELENIPWGKTSNYSAIAHQLNNPKAVRAVGMANGRNPFPIFIPCHRVIGKNNNLTGYAFGLDVKEWLLQHEGAISLQSTLF